MDTSADGALIAEAAAWAAGRKRPLDSALLATVLQLRAAYDDRSAGSWPEGSARDLVLVRWPAHGPADLPASDTLAGTLETFWRFLRGTGRMSMASAEPAVLVKELRRALPAMADACADRSNWSQGRVLGDFGASIGIDLSPSDSFEDTQAKFGAIVARWNELPVAERKRLMPDPSPKSAAGAEMTDALAAMREGAYDDGRGFDAADLDDVSGRMRGDPVAAGRQARESAFVRACLDLVRWTGMRKEVTAIGVLRLAAAREACRELGLYDWEEAHGRFAAFREAEHTPQARAQLAESWANSFASAGDCEPLHRLWEACIGAELIRVQTTVASARLPKPAGDADWLQLAVLLMVGLAWTMDRDAIDALLSTLDLLAGRPDGEAAVAEVHERWLDGSGFAEDPLRRAGWEDVTRRAYLRPLEDALRNYDDTGVWTRRIGWLAITDLGREFAGVLAACIDQGLFDQMFGE